VGRNVLKLDVKGFDEYAEKLDSLGADLKTIFTDALEQAGETITEDTIDAMADANLPRGGEYSTGETKASIIKNPHVEWAGTIGSIGVGFDFGKPGAGGYLITGTPRMRPDKPLNQIYKSKKYMSDIRKDMVDIFNDEIKRRMGG
jgi:hypothetical protein